MAEVKEGLAIAHLGQGIAVENNGRIILCQPLRKLDTIAVGDKVLWSEAAPGQGRIEEILPRHSLLMRPARNGKTRPVAANIDRVVVIFAMEPRYDCLLIDQYLAICENSNFKVALVLNKADLPGTEEADRELAVYVGLGYPIYKVSAKTGMGLEGLKQALQGQVSIFTGQSGVGKSSLTRVFIPDKEIKINAISASAKLGRHTTTAATLYHLKEGGNLIDSPGVAIFGLADLTADELAYGYKEFRPYIGNCRFNDCRHEQDKGCAIRTAVEKGTISECRYRRFLKLKDKIPLKPR
ncbi:MULTISPECIES: ribosome small subunit-dependent GTPase A [Methylomicrobium]|uniref:Small ribosomal subunit biogenesis GTPase RsgA n=1 Tax=Methylomicrobium album BG8 TaxID=686340 RepID=H8GPZ1_METAL|nr:MULTISPECIES: ribosome small subunit-dependent GTPase A [Methylomicrobium]EIC29770.1 ribosome small subunit-dependent GTPase A [Methylomicrobium album BG8]